MADRPILFSAPMIRALLEGRKTQTRRVAKFIADDSDRGHIHNAVGGERWRLRNRHGGIFNVPDAHVRIYGPDYAPYAIGDRLWVREAFNAFQFSQDGDEAWPVKVPTLQECQEAEEEGYRFGAPQIIYRESDRARKSFADQPWRPSMHMPRWASRLTLAVTGVKVERLQDISEADAQAEGVFVPEAQYAQQGSAAPRLAFSGLWESIHGPGAWGANPWVVALTFTVHRCNIDQMEVNRG